MVGAGAGRTAGEGVHAEQRAKACRECVGAGESVQVRRRHPRVGDGHRRRRRGQWRARGAPKDSGGLRAWDRVLGWPARGGGAVRGVPMPNSTNPTGMGYTPSCPASRRAPGGYRMRVLPGGGERAQRLGGGGRPRIRSVLGPPTEREEPNLPGGLRKQQHQTKSKTGVTNFPARMTTSGGTRPLTQARTQDPRDEGARAGSGGATSCVKRCVASGDGSAAFERKENERKEKGKEKSKE